MSRSIALPLILATVVLSACDNAEDSALLTGPATNTAHNTEDVTVMTRNLYLGADLDPIFAAAPQEIPFVAAQVWGQIQASDFPRRAGALAAEIASRQPQLVGLQEVVQYYVQSPGDAAIGGSTRATAIRYDFLQLLLDSLAARGSHYTAAAINTNSDVELPVYTGQGPLPFDDIRFVDRDVILVRSGVAVSNATSSNYDAKVSIPVAGSTIDQIRGWSSVQVTVNSHSFRFVNTHLETQGFAPVQDAQITQLLNALGSPTAPMIVVGDLNSAADGSQTPTYGKLLTAGFADAWDQSSAGYTCCSLPDLSNTKPIFDQRLDLILTRGFVSVKSKPEITGDKSVDRERSGIWASDHAGLFAKLTIQ